MPWFGGAIDTELIAPDFSKNPQEWAPQYAGGKPDKGAMAKYYDEQRKKQTHGTNADEYMEDWAHQGQANQLADRQRLQQMYGTLQKQAAGGMTPQQAQQISGMQQAAQMQGAAAMSAAGGARARAGAQAAVTAGAGIQAGRNQQQVAMQKNADMMQAQQQMQQVSAMQRASDLQAQGLTAEDAQRQAQMEVQARGLNIQSELGYAGMQAGAIQNDYQAYLDAYRRYKKKQGIDQAETDSLVNTGMQMGTTAVSGGMTTMGSE